MNKYLLKWEQVGMKEQKSYSLIPSVVIALTLVIAVEFFPLVKGLWRVYQVEAMAQRFMPHDWHAMHLDEKQRILRPVKCSIMHEQISQMRLISRNHRDITLIELYHCDPIQIWKLTQSFGT
jgi:hypothetical protein